MPDPEGCLSPQLTALTRQIEACRICRDGPKGKALPHEPRPVVRPSSTARLAIAGQAPGLRVHQSGEPFLDRSGDRLRDWMGVDHDTFYDSSRIAIIPMGFCFPGYDAKGSDLPPRRECAPSWRRALFDLMPQIELILLIGGYAQRWHLGPDCPKTVTETVSRWQSIAAREGKPACLPLPHPSWRNTGWLKRNPWFDAETVPFLRRQVAKLTTQGDF